MSYYIVNTDNYGSDYPDESFVTLTDSNETSYRLSYESKETAQQVADVFNKSRQGDSRYFKVVSSDYSLQGPFEP